MAHGFDSDADAIAELFRRVEHMEGQLKIHGETSERNAEFVKKEMATTRAAIDVSADQVRKQHDEVGKMHRDLMADRKA